MRQRRVTQEVLTTCIVLAVLSVFPMKVAATATEWVWPLDHPEVVREFDLPDAPWDPGHRGVDLAGQAGDPVGAAGAGTVSYAGLLAGVGVVTVSHGELRTTYQPVAATVVTGQQVSAGEQIGTLSASGSHCPPDACLHWGVIRGQEYLDPLSLIGTPGRPRLLPLDAEVALPHRPPTPALAERGDVVPGPGSVTGIAGRGALAGAR